MKEIKWNDKKLLPLLNRDMVEHHKRYKTPKSLNKYDSDKIAEASAVPTNVHQNRKLTSTRLTM